MSPGCHLTCDASIFKGTDPIDASINTERLLISSNDRQS